MQHNLVVTKRNGELEPLDLSKIHAVIQWACHGDEIFSPIKGVSVSQIEMTANPHFSNKIKTKDIHQMLIKAAADLISEDTPNYDQVAARLNWLAIRKEAFNSNNPPHLYEVIKMNVERGVYSKELLTMYSYEEYDILNSMIDHTRDDLFKYAGSEQMRKKYLVQNRKTKQIYETFQFPYILVPAILFSRYPEETRFSYIKKFYDLASQHYISLPTPIMAGLRTNVKQFSSCTLIDCGDSLESIKATSNAIIDYASRKAGIGLNVGRLRAEGQPVRGGEAVTTGLVPFLKLMNASLRSISQGGLRSASCSVNYPGWHLEFEKLIELKNNKGTEETRIRTLDYVVAINGLMIKRLITGGDITFFSPEEVPDLYEAFYSSDTEKFEELYIKYENSSRITKKSMSAQEFFTKLLTERFETGRIYIFFADNVNSQTPFYESIYMTNLCTEILLNTVPMAHQDEMIALCTLGGVNMGKFSKSLSEKEETLLKACCDILVRGLDALLSYQEYPVDAAKRSTETYRPLGIGIIGFAHWLAKGRLLWGEQNTNEQVEHFFESMQYYLIESSNQLAKEFGPLTIKSKYSDGIFPFEMNKVPLNIQLKHDWETLRSSLKDHGIRNITLSTGFPAETSSQLSNETNGIEPPRDLISIKGSKDGVLPQVVPEYSKLNNVYQTLWEVDSKDYLSTVSSIQKFFDQSISTNTSYNPAKGEITMSKLIDDLIFAYSQGIKTFYYNQTNDLAGEEVEEDGCESGACKL
jgi:ribonucleoside-diphosphate reductase alpha chain